MLAFVPFSDSCRCSTMDEPQIEMCVAVIETTSGQRKLPDAWASGLISRLRNRLDVLKVCGGQLAALAHNVVGELLPFIEVTHSGALDCGNMHEDVLSAVGRLNETETFL